MSALEEVGEIKPGYSTCPRSSTLLPPSRRGGGLLKWYDIAEGDKPVPRDIGALAREGLREAAAGDALAASSGSSSCTAVARTSTSC